MRNSSFDKLKNEEKARGFRERPHNVEAFFRKGRAGDWRESLPPEVARQIVRNHEEVMREMGYGELVEEVLSESVL